MVLELIIGEEKFVFKFPLSIMNYDILREAKILQFLDGRISAVIPQVFYIGQTYPYFAYKEVVLLGWTGKWQS